jgi:hypothetical protein
MSDLSPIPYRVPPIQGHPGRISRNWAQFLEALLARIGGAGDIITLADLATAIESGLGTEGLQALVAALTQRLAGAEVLGAFGPTPIPAPDVLPEFADATVASQDALRSDLTDIEALTLFSG